MRLYLHEDLDLLAAIDSWSELTDVPASQFNKSDRAVADETRRGNRHVYGCCRVVYSSTPALRKLLGLMDALVSSVPDPG